MTFLFIRMNWIFYISYQTEKFNKDNIDDGMFGAVVISPA